MWALPQNLSKLDSRSGRRFKSVAQTVLPAQPCWLLFCTRNNFLNNLDRIFSGDSAKNRPVRILISADRAALSTPLILHHFMYLRVCLFMFVKASADCKLDPIQVLPFRAAAPSLQFKVVYFEGSREPLTSAREKFTLLAGKLRFRSIAVPVLKAFS